MCNDVVNFRNIGKSFGGVRALEEVTFGVERGHIHGLVGENGAGKSTLLKILCGEIARYDGEIEIDQAAVRFKKPADALSAGINMVHQELNLCTNLNIIDNIFLGKEKLYSKSEKESIINNSMKELGINLPLNVPVKRFSLAQKQMLEIIKCTVSEIKLLIMDEPTSSLNPVEVAKLFGLMRMLKDKGVTILFVSHRLEEVLEIADVVTVLRDGRFIAKKAIEELDGNAIISLMVGRELVQKEHIKRDFSQENPIIEVKELSRDPYFHNCSIDVKAGEIVGIAGLEGCGRYELAEALFGLVGRVKGEIYVEGKKYVPKSPDAAIMKGIGFVDRERKEAGVISNMDLTDNTLIIRQRKDFWKNKTASNAVAKELLERINVKYSDVKQRITSLSGGNQQKCIFARLLAMDPKLLIMEEPTRGIDVGSKAEILAIIKDMAASGKGVIVISSELPELINECDRIYVMSRGRITGEVFAADTTQEEIMALATVT